METNNKKKRTFCNLMQEIIDYNKVRGKVRTAETYESTMRSFMRFRLEKDMPLCMLSTELYEEYIYFLQRRALRQNTIAFYMRRLRAMHNYAVRKGVPIGTVDFKTSFVKNEKTAKRAIPIQFVRQLKEVGLSSMPELEWARDLFMLSFYLRGMSFVDLAYLRKSDLKYGVLSYRRRKTGQLLHIKWESQMETIFQKYATHTSDYLLPIIVYQGVDERQQYLKALGRVNRCLKIIANLLNFSCNLTMYVARHSWATIAKHKHIPISVISEALGHDNESTTKIYLDSLEQHEVDNANSMIIGLL